ncbi:stabilin-2-like [Lates calcarifer]|uniref:Stabilin-2-like n=1 Tax=Lates calcarifer TaxID=8187 RepID=A0AAJ8BL58_LATCA|nr:stabilin-2-like [Lates calcarifer]
MSPQSSRYINDCFVTSLDILASNGIIHVLQGPLKAPPPRHEMHMAHKAGMGVGVVLLIVLVGGGRLRRLPLLHPHLQTLPLPLLQGGGGGGGGGRGSTCRWRSQHL